MPMYTYYVKYLNYVKVRSHMIYEMYYVTVWSVHHAWIIVGIIVQAKLPIYTVTYTVSAVILHPPPKGKDLPSWESTPLSPT